MNAYQRTTIDLANALMGKPRAAQTVHVCRTFGYGSPFGPRHIVLVIPEGEKRGTEYECGDRTLALLKSGMSPEDLELEPVEDEFDEFEDDHCHTDLMRKTGAFG